MQQKKTEAMKNCIPYQKAWGPWERQHTPSAPHDGCIMLAKDRVQVSKIWITGYWLWSRLSYLCDCCKSMKNCRDSSFSLRGLEAGLPAFQLSMFAKCDALPKQIKESRHPVPTSSLRFLRAALWLHHAHPFVAAAEKGLVSCREAEGLVTELWSPRIVKIYISIYWLCSYVTASF